MKKFKVSIEACGTWRDRQSFEIEAENKEEAEEIARDEFNQPNVSRCEVNDMDFTTKEID